MEKLISDIDVSRSAPAGIFLELETAARSTFHDVKQHTSDETSGSVASQSYTFQDNLHGSVNGKGAYGKGKGAYGSGNDTPYEISKLGTQRHGKDNFSDRSMENSRPTLDHAASSKDFIHDRSSIDGAENTANDIALHLDGTEFKLGMKYSKSNVHVKRLSTESIGSDLSSLQDSETTNSAVTTLLQDASYEHTGSRESSRNSDLLVVLPLDDQHKLNRILTTQQQRVATARTDVEDLLARLNQEIAARQYLMTKVKDYSSELQRKHATSCFE